MLPNMSDRAFLLLDHCVKIVQIRSFSGPYFPTFGLNRERYEVSLCIQSECGKIRTRKHSVFGHLSHNGYFYYLRKRFPSQMFERINTPWKDTKHKTKQKTVSVWAGRKKRNNLNQSIKYGHLGQSETLFWLINYNSKTVHMINHKLGMIRPWFLLHKQQKVYK